MRAFVFFTDFLCFLYLSLLSYLDIRSRRVPDSVVFSLFLTLLFFDICHSYEMIPLKVCSGSLFFAILFCIAYFTKGLGMGDCKLAFVTGYEFGFVVSSLSFALGSVLALLFYGICHVKKRGVEKIPFVPFITGGIMIVSLLCRWFGEIS